MDRLYAVPTTDIGLLWYAVEPLISAACEYNGNRYLADDCRQELESGHKQLWVVMDKALRAVVITQIIPFPQKKCCCIDICTGDGLHEWAHLRTMIEDWARDQGCKQMIHSARPGMAKLLTDYRKTHVILEKDL